MSKGKRTEFRVSDEEYETLKSNAGAEGISQWLRRIGCNYSVDAIVNQEPFTESFSEPITVEYHEPLSRPLYGDRLLSDNRPLLNTEEERQRKISIAVEALVDAAPDVDSPVF